MKLQISSSAFLASAGANVGRCTLNILASVGRPLWRWLLWSFPKSRLSQLELSETSEGVRSPLV